MHVATSALPVLVGLGSLAACTNGGGGGGGDDGGDGGDGTVTAGVTVSAGPETGVAPTSTGSGGPVPTTGPSATTTGELTGASSGSSTQGVQEDTGAVTTGTGEPGSTTSSSTSGDGTDSSSTGDAVCPEDGVVCESGAAKVCDGLGGFKSEMACPQVCVDGKGCLACVPGEGVCAGDVAQVCAEDGQGVVDVACDAVQGVTCEPALGKCVGACAPDSLGRSYIGCDYYPTVTSTGVVDKFEFAVVVANTSPALAKLRIERGAQVLLEGTVAAGAVKVVKLPWVAELKGLKATPSQRVVDGAYHLRTDQPVTVYQYSPLDYQKGEEFSSVNDASLLLPVNTWTGDYWVIARDTFYYATGKESYAGFYAVTASENATTVTLTPGATGKLVRAGGGVAVDGTGVVTLDQGDVLQVMSGDHPNNIDAPDVTGTHVTADRPVQVMGGHFCTYIPPDKGYCEHLEESLLPTEALGRVYITAPALIEGGGALPKPHMVRIVATRDDTTLVYDPPLPGAPAVIAEAGAWVEIAKTGVDFEVTANHKIVVAQYMQGQEAGGNTGDPAMALAVPVGQYRANYLFHAPTNYEKNYVNIIAPKDVAVSLDGAPVGGFTAIGATGFEVARVPVPHNADGDHTVTAAQPISISVYGYGQYTSYWYPGGLDLNVIPQ